MVAWKEVWNINKVKFIKDFCFLRLIEEILSHLKTEFIDRFLLLKFHLHMDNQYSWHHLLKCFFFCYFIMQTVSFIKVLFMQRYVNGSLFAYFHINTVCPNEYFVKHFSVLTTASTLPNLVANSCHTLIWPIRNMWHSWSLTPLDTRTQLSQCSPPH